MAKIQKKTLEAVLDEWQGESSLKDSIDELVDSKMGLISGFQDMVDAITKLKTDNIEDYSPF